MSLPYEGQRRPPLPLPLPSPSADAIAGHEDMMTEILIRLPAKSLYRFKCVSKRWNSLISHPHFSLLRMPHSSSGFFLPIVARLKTPLYKYVHLAGKPPRSLPFKSLTFGDDRLTILHSCNGLFLCSSSANGTEIHKNSYYIYNPTSNQVSIIPPPLIVLDPIFRPLMNLAFDLSRAPHYNIVLVQHRQKFGYHIQIYSSETGVWRLSQNPFPARLVSFTNGVFLNGSIHWPSDRLDTSLRFNMDRECLETMPMPQTQGNSNYKIVGYFGESRGHLHLVYKNYFTLPNPFDVFEMESDYSNWFVKYHVDLDAITTTFPVFKQRPNFCILHIVRGEVEEESYLVLLVEGMLVSYNLNDNTFKKICDLELGVKTDFILYPGRPPNVHQYIETLF